MDRPLTKDEIDEARKRILDMYPLHDKRVIDIFPEIKRLYLWIISVFKNCMSEDLKSKI